METEQLMTLIMGAGAALAAAIGVLFKTVMGLHKEHRDMLREHGEMKHQLGQMKGEREGIERLTADVLETIHKVLGRHQSRPNDVVDNHKNDISEEAIRRRCNL